MRAAAGSVAVRFYAQVCTRKLAAVAARRPRDGQEERLSDEEQVCARKGNSMRLDKYLKVSRLIKRRTVANEACDAGRVLVNGKSAKASVSVKEGDQIEIQFGEKAVKVEVLSVQETVRKEEAAEMYRYL